MEKTRQYSLVREGPSFAPEVRLRREHGLAGRALVAGIDEVGRGPWAGPVLAGAVVFLERPPASMMERIDDSKKLTPCRRVELAAWLRGMPDRVACAVGAASAAEIDRIGIVPATLAAMRRAFCLLPAIIPDVVLVDGVNPPSLPCPVRCLVGGDRLSLSVAAASILAKVTRDELMTCLGLRYPEYDWARNKGYGAPAHRDALSRIGACRHHRRSFRPIRELL